ncbi:hypothetical protein ACTFIZ_009959 [Dictyostelium cf. discoideum]
MDYFQAWLLFIGIFRVLSSFTALLYPGYMSIGYSGKNKQNFSGLISRIIFLWLFTTGSITIACSMDLSNRTVYFLCWLTFITGLGHFLTEYFYFKSNQLKNILIQLFLAVPSILIMSSTILSW